MKFDKDTILKQKFWFLLALAVPLILVAFFILMTSVRSAIAKDRQKLEGDLKGVAGSPIMNQKWVDAMEAKAAEKAEREKEVWAEAYDFQKPLFTWPEQIENGFRFTDGLFATQIKAEKKGTGTPGKGDASHFAGTISSSNDNVIEVTNPAEIKPKPFQRTAKVKVSLDGKDTDWASLKPGYQVTVTFLKGKYFFDPLTNQEQDKFVEVYKDQVPEILQQVQPVNDKGEGVVQLHNWAYDKKGFPPANALFFRYVAKEPEQWNAKHDISQEAWMAQEDLWVQREIYRIIREANDSVSEFKDKGGQGKGKGAEGKDKGGQGKDEGAEGKGKGGEGLGKAFTFENPYWELTVTAAGKKKLDIKIKNLLPRRQRLDLSFLVQLQKKISSAEQLEKITIGGEPLGPRGSADDSRETSHDVRGQAATGIYGVEQVINWETAAVKRIDHISFGGLGGGDCSHSHRTYPQGLKPFQEKKGKGPVVTKGPDNKGLPDPLTMKDKDKGKGVADAGITPNGLKANRYLEPPSRQTRRIPIGVALIVDQEHVDRVLLAFSKSKLRFLTTQVILNRYPHSLRPTVGTQPGGKDDFNPKGFGGEAGFPSGLGGLRERPTTSPSAGSDQESNVELVIYGIVTLYERYPPRAKAP
jgi:hypothetical protein